MNTLNIQFTLFSAFYSPLIITMAGGFLKEEGLETNWSIAEPGTSAIKALLDGSADVIQTAPSQGICSAEEGKDPEVLHFAQVNEMDGFFVSSRKASGSSIADFDWRSLEGAEVVMFASGQPNVMFRYACDQAGIDFEKIKAITPGGAAAIDEAFRSGQGDFVQQQGPYPQQLEADGVGHIVALCGPLIGSNAFSSLAARPQWLQSDQAKAFSRAYRRARKYLMEMPASDLANLMNPYFVEAGQQVDASVLAKCIESYQKLGCWTTHPEITHSAFESTVDIYMHSGGIDERCPYNKVCAPPPL